MNREEMIRRLVSFSVEAALREPHSYWLQEMFEKGFAGYRKFSLSRLKREMELRGLDAMSEDEDYEDEPDDALLTEDVPESIPRYAGHGGDQD